MSTQALAQEKPLAASSPPALNVATPDLGTTQPPVPEFEAELSQEERRRIHEQVKALSLLNPWWSFGAVAFDWTVIFATMAAMHHWPHWWLYLLGITLIATRQHGLLLIVHDAAHYRLVANRKWNDLLGNLLCAWPTLFTTVEAYRTNHLQHHWHTNTERDPDWMRKLGKPDWKFPRRLAAVLGDFLWQGVGGGVLELVNGARSIRKANVTANAGAAAPRPSRLRLVYILSLLAIVIATGNFLNLLIYWIVPFFTVLTVIFRIRSVAEHFGVEYDHELRQTRTVVPGPLERFIFSQHNANYHLEHHCYPSVPWYRLPALHRLLNAVPAYRNNAHENTSYFLPGRRPFIRDLVDSQ